MCNARVLLATLSLVAVGRGAPVEPKHARSLKGVDMMGQCAVVAHHDVWEDEDTGQVYHDFGPGTLAYMLSLLIQS